MVREGEEGDIDARRTCEVFKASKEVSPGVEEREAELMGEPSGVREEEEEDGSW